jgi:transcriptional repressor NrdR
VKCPFCSHLDSKVIDSRVSTAGDVIRRRRECEACSRRFTSRERVEDVLPVVVKKGGERQPFDREKVLRSVRLACNKRPVAVDGIERFVEELERELVETEAKEVASREIGERVMRRLRELDEVAYVRFASVYRSFRDIDEFRSELDRMMAEENSQGPDTEPGSTAQPAAGRTSSRGETQ